MATELRVVQFWSEIYDGPQVHIKFKSPTKFKSLTEFESLTLNWNHSHRIRNTHTKFKLFTPNSKILAHTDFIFKSTVTHIWNTTNNSWNTTQCFWNATQYFWSTTQYFRNTRQNYRNTTQNYRNTTQNYQNTTQNHQYRIDVWLYNV